MCFTISNSVLPSVRLCVCVCLCPCVCGCQSVSCPCLSVQVLHSTARVLFQLVCIHTRTYTWHLCTHAWYARITCTQSHARTHNCAGLESAAEQVSRQRRMILATLLAGLFVGLLQFQKLALVPSPQTCLEGSTNHVFASCLSR